MIIKENRVLATRNCAYCGDKDAVIVTTKVKKHQRDTRRFCSMRCSRRGTRGSPNRRQKALNASVSEIRKAAGVGLSALEEAARNIYYRGYGAGTFVGQKLGVVKERRRLMRLAIQARKARLAA